MTRQQLFSGRHSSGDGSGPVLHSARSFEMMQKMPATLEQTGSNLVTPRSAFILRFISTIGLWTVALLIMFSGYEILFCLLYVLWLYNFITKIVYLTPRSSTGQLTGQFYVLYLIAVTKFSDMGAYLTGSVIGRHLMVPHISRKKTWEGFFGAIVFALMC